MEILGGIWLKKILDKDGLSEVKQGVFYMLIAAFCGALMGAFAKALSGDMDTLEVVFFRNIIGVVLVLITIYKKPIKQKGGRPFLLFFRGFIGFVALLAWFYNVSQISLADAITFSNTSPIWTAFFAYLFLGEKLGKLGWLAIFVGFAGLVFIVRPVGFTMSYTDVIGIFSGLGAGLAYTSIRELRVHYETRAIVLSFMGAGTLGPILLALVPLSLQPSGLEFMFGSFKMPLGMEWFYIAGLGIFATLMQTFMTKAYGATKAGIVGAVSYVNIVFSTFLGVAMGDSFPDAIGILGIILIICSGVLVSRSK